MDDLDHNEHEVDTGLDENSKKKRRTVNVSFAGDRAVQIRSHSPAAHQMAPQLPTGEGMILQPGSNPGVDKEWFEGWLDENKNLSLVTSGAIQVTDEEPAEDE